MPTNVATEKPMAIETLTNPTTWSPMDILTSTETFVIGGILAVFFVLNEIFPMVYFI